MSILLIVIIIVSILLMLGYGAYLDCRYDLNGSWSMFIVISFIIVVCVFLLVDLKLNNPSAIDVYRGKTELEIHSINGLPQDTVVVWKNIEK